MSGQSFHIVHVMPWLARGGSEKLFGDLSLRLKALGHRVTVIAGEDGPWHAELAAHAIPVILLPPYAQKGIHSRTGRLSNLYAVIWLAHRFRQLQPDVVSACQYPTAYLSVIAARLAGIPVRLTNYHNLNDLRAIKPLPRWIERLAYRCITGAVAQCQGVAHRIHQTENLPLEALTVIYSGVEMPTISEPFARRARAARGFDEQTVVVGMLARFVPVKNHLHLIRVLPAVIEQAPNVKVLLGGRSGPCLDEVRQAIQAAQLSAYVQVEPDTDPPDFLAALDIGVLCSVSEGFSYAVLEYMAYGKPVIAVQMESLAESIHNGETGYLIEANDDAALASALLDLIHHPARRAQFGLAGRARVQAHFSLDQELAQWLALFEHQLAGRDRRQ